MSQTRLLDARVWELLVEADRERAGEARAGGCACGGRLHSARYRRKPRGGVPVELREAYGQRESLCCARCRKRVTPPSVRFLGRRVYLAALVVLVSAMTGGVTAGRAARMEALMGVSIRTLQRWRAWWLRTFPQTHFWKEGRGRLVPRVEESRLPASLLERFGTAAEQVGDGLVGCLRFLCPITTREGGTVAV